MSLGLHQLAERRSLEAHRLIAARLPSEPRIADLARERVAQWRAEGSVTPFYIEAWTELLEAPMATLAELLVAESEEAKALRQVTPFAGVLSPRERWALWREVRHGAGR